MRNQLLVGVLAGALLAACGAPVCDKNESLDWAAKQGDCGGRGGKALDSCTSNLKACEGGDQKLLEGMLDCLAELPVCNQADQASWASSQRGCYAQLPA